MVVLSVGFEVGQGTVELAKRLGIDLNKHNFAATDGFLPVATSRPGIYVCGTLQGPKDIPQSVMEASGAAAGSSALLSEVRWTETKTRELPPERDISAEDRRVSACLSATAASTSAASWMCRRYANMRGRSPTSSMWKTTCSPVLRTPRCAWAKSSRKRASTAWWLSACTPLTHEALFRETLLEVGLNKYLFDMANIRNQDSWVHMNDRASATAKAKDLVRMAVARAALLKPLQERKVDINQRGLGDRRRYCRPQRDPQPGPAGIRSGPGGKGQGTGRSGAESFAHHRRAGSHNPTSTSSLPMCVATARSPC